MVPLYGDMHISVLFVLKRCAHWTDDMQKQWQTSKPQKLAVRYELVNHLAEIRKDYSEITSEYSALLNEIKAYIVRFRAWCFHV